MRNFEHCSKRLRFTFPYL